MLNKAQIIGNLGADPKVSLGQNNSKIVTFTVATTDKGYTTRDGKRIPDRTEWHNIVCFLGLADIAAQYLHKGSKVYIEGKMRTRNYDKDGQKHYVMEIVADNMEMLDPKPQSPVPQSEYQQYLSQYQQATPQKDAQNDSVPF